MTALSTLRVNFFNPSFPPINLASCLYACPPSLKVLSIQCSKLTVEPFTKKLNSIETLHIGFLTLTSGLGEIISSCFPNLLQLDLTCEVTEDATVVLKNPLFHKATFSTSRVCINTNVTHGFSFVWPNQNKSLHYINQRREQYMSMRRKRFVPYERTKDVPVVTIVAFTEKKVDTRGAVRATCC